MGEADRKASTRLQCSTKKTQVRSPSREDPLEKEMATRSSILAWKNPMDRGAWSLQESNSTEHILSRKEAKLEEVGLQSSVEDNWDGLKEPLWTVES